jgi:hypothetical protein
MMISEIIHCSIEKFGGNKDAYYNFKRHVTTARSNMKLSELYLTNNETEEWGIEVTQALYQLDRFEFED